MYMYKGNYGIFTQGSNFTHSFMLTAGRTSLSRGGSRGGGVLGVRTPPPPLGDPQTSYRGKKCHGLVLNSYPDPPPPFRNPVIAPALHHFFQPTCYNHGD